MIATYDIMHQTQYRYSEPVPICQNELRMRPQALPGLQCQSCTIDIRPRPETLFSYVDYFGNGVDSFAIESPHQSLTVVVRSRVSVTGRSDADLGPGPAWRDLIAAVKSGDDSDHMAAGEFTFASRRIDLRETYAAYARPIFESEPLLIKAVAELTRLIRHEFKYDPAATGVDTTTEEAFKLKAGVCQDFSHIELACLRSLGIPARYVSGYLRTNPPPGQPRLVGADQSHAWISVYAGTEIGWVDFDPTNACRTGIDHVPVCVGRDYDDISPMRGIVLGGGTTTLSVNVDVAPVKPNVKPGPVHAGGSAP